MDDHPNKLEYIAPAMNEFITKLQGFDTLLTSEQKTSTLRAILTDVEDLRKALKKTAGQTDKATLYDSQIERIFSEFNWNVNYTIKPNEYEKFMSCCKSLAGSVMKMLGRRNCGVLVVEMYFKMNIKLINELSLSIEENSNILKDLLLFQLLIKGFLSSVKVLKRFWYVIVLPQHKCSVMLCLNQSFKTIRFLGKVIDKRLTHLNIYLLNRLKQCFQKTIDVLLDKKEEWTNSEFIVLMDSCLNKLDHLAYEITLREDITTDNAADLSSLKALLDELLCHAMTISQISSRESDCESIKCYSKKVLDEYNYMNEGVNTPDLGSRADRLSVILCQLEEIVNVAVLNVVLDVFTNINDPIRNLVNRCNEQTELPEHKSANDLEDEIAVFDEHLDKIMQIGLFAVSCSTDVKKILEIRSCLASLESLEPELITSVISLYLHSNAETKTTFQYIFRNWLEEINELKNLMDLVVDPTAFCKVVEKRIASLLYEIKNDDGITAAKISTALSGILSYAKKLMKTLTRSIEYDEEESKKKMAEYVDNLRIASQECEASLSLLDTELPVTEVSDRIFKRIILIIRAINNIIRNISDDDVLEIMDDFNEEFSSIRIFNNGGNLDVYNINAITPEPAATPNMEVLTPYINRGKQRTKERTILYHTPKHPQHFQRTPMSSGPQLRLYKEGTSTRSRSRCCRPLPRNLELENSLDLELTALLDNVTDLSNTFGASHEVPRVQEEGPEEKEVKRTIPAPPITEENPEEKVFLGTLMRRKLDQSLTELGNSASLSIHKDSNCRYETPERLHDLTLVEQKINFLMEHMND